MALLKVRGSELHVAADKNTGLLGRLNMEIAYLWWPTVTCSKRDMYE